MNARVGCAQTPKLGETVCGDDVLVLRDDTTLVAVVDGLGHGQAAAEASACFTDYARKRRDLSPAEILESSTREMAKTRGAVAAVARFDTLSRTVVVAGVGNIEVRSLSRTPVSPVFTPGIVGRPVRYVREFRYPLSVGDLVVFASDGISRRFDLRAYADLGVEEIAHGVLRDFGVSHDDATCVAVYMEAGSDAA